MPRCGSQVVLCDVPVRFDTYVGCSHGCQYCFAAKKRDMSQITKGETAKSLTAFIHGSRTTETNWCDWNIPLHWGGMSDPFQPIEQQLGNSYKCLQVFAKTQYPFIFSTKGQLVAESRYLRLIHQCNCVGQISLVSPQLDRIEPGAPSFTKRLAIAQELAKAVKRLVIRVQPYWPTLRDDVLAAIPQYAKIGVYGIVVEGLKSLRRRFPCTEKVAGDFCLPLKDLHQDFAKIKTACRKAGIQFLAGENRLRWMGDSLCCCGVEGIPGWTLNRTNLNHIYFDKAKPIRFTPAMKEKGKALVFKVLSQEPRHSRTLYKLTSFQEFMMAYARSDKGRAIYGIHREAA